MSRETLVTTVAALLAAICFTLSLVGASYVVQKARALPAEEPPAVAVPADTGEVNKIHTQKEIPAETLTEAVEVVLLKTCVIEEPVPVEEPTPEPEPSVRYELTDAERAVVESVVMAESGAEPFEGQMAVAQCILHGCEDLGLRPDAVVIENGYTPWRPQPTQSVKDAVSAVFDRGEVAVEDTILWFYAPARVYASWHEAQRYVCTIGGHKFFGKW